MNRGHRGETSPSPDGASPVDTATRICIMLQETRFRPQNDHPGQFMKGHGSHIVSRSARPDAAEDW